MGGKSLMKKIFSLTLLTVTSLFSVTLSSAEITNMISEIKKERVGISLVKLENTLNPFLLKEKEKVIPKEHKKELLAKAVAEIEYKLDAILNHAVFINKKWYKVGDTLGNYKVGYISRTSVRLKSDAGNKVLSLEKKKNFIKLNQGYRK